MVMIALHIITYLVTNKETPVNNIFTNEFFHQVNEINLKYFLQFVAKVIGSVVGGGG